MIDDVRCKFFALGIYIAFLDVQSGIQFNSGTNITIYPTSFWIMIIIFLEMKMLWIIVKGRSI